MNKLFLFNTLTRQKEEFKPLKKGRVSLYTCGPTVYDYAHIGNLRTYIFEDILRRTLEFNRYKVKHVMNITDVGHLTSDADEGEDKLEKGAKREGQPIWKMVEFYTHAFKTNLTELNILEPKQWCRATDYIKEQIKFVRQLEKKALTYKTPDGLYFNTAKYPDYARLAKLNVAGQQAGARVEVNAAKINPTDFALWKFSYLNGRAFDAAQDDAGARRQMEWDSPWGIGFPGWHLECSVMSLKKLGKKFDIHCGGIDHIPVHHTNERAQNWGLTNQEAVRFWVHGEFLIINDAKMAKSEGNFITLQTFKDKGINPLAYRYFVLQAHYRSKLNFSWEALAAAQTGYNNLIREIAGLDRPGKACHTCLGKFTTAVNDDLNTPAALAVVQELLKSDKPSSKKRQTIVEFDKVLGLNLNQYKVDQALGDRVKKLIEERQAARQNKDYQKADELRRRIEDQGIRIKDLPDGGYEIES